MSTDPDIGSDVQPGCLPPRERYDLFGHDAAEQAFADAWQSGRLHHAWMITGPRGVGKATLAWRAARRVLGARAMPEAGPLGAGAQDPVCKLIESQATPDLLLLRRPWDEKRKRWRGEITVEEARRAPHFFEMSSGGGGWRVCIVDSADDMNNNAANALLKTLEEPPHRGVLFLVTHTPGRLPATIRSRCRRLSLRAPSVEATAGWLEETGAADNAGSALAASKLAGGAPGRALTLIAGGGVELAAEVNLLVDRGAAASDADIRKIADRLSLKGQEEMRDLFYEVLANAIRVQARDRAEAGRDVTDWLDSWRNLNTLVRDANALYLDPKQTILSALGQVRDVARKEKARA
ncbi:DNA polymerase III subunit delta' [Maricaulis maris]|uniref:DNA polymerase III delta prime subunit n=1 Tax=Maricaulis maris TaxID=74318 RepID=A0A495DJL2_9PROT|nr:DNA polymerase III subunit delta' [Maricaulis maris]RKR02810.1 DNA polymerase III delta prime subunit [Maricaulis maris]